MSIEALAWALDRDELGTAHRFVLLVLANCYNRNDDACFPSQDYIARKTSLTRTYVNRVLADLERDGYINILPRARKNGSSTSNDYQLNLPEPEPTREFKSKPPPGFVYVFAAENKVKVGITRNAEGRRMSIETGIGEVVHIIKIWKLDMRDARKVELAAFETLKQYRLRGEWFCCDAGAAVQAVESAHCVLSTQPESTQYTPTVDSVHTHKQESNLKIKQEDSNAPTARASPLREELFEDAEPVDEPPKAKLFRKGKTALVSLGLSEQRSGAVIGQWLKQRYDPIGILAAIDYAQKQCAISPVAYVTQILKGSGNGKHNFDDQIRELADRARELEGAKGPGG